MFANDEIVYSAPPADTKSKLSRRMAGRLEIPFLGRIPIDPQLMQACDAGDVYPGAYNRPETADAFRHTAERVLMLDSREKNGRNKRDSERSTDNANSNSCFRRQINPAFRPL